MKEKQTQYYLLQYTPEADYGPTYFIVNQDGRKVADALLRKGELLRNAAERGITGVKEDIPEEVLTLAKATYRAFSKQISKVKPE